MEEPTLYYFPGSYYSLKVLFTLYEKGVSFKEQVIDIRCGEQNQPWYLKVNQNGEVPVLKIGDKYIADSEAIIDAIDHTFTSGPRLVPDVETGIGREVADFRKMLQDIPIYVITFGMLANRQFCVTEMQLPKMMLLLNNKDKLGKVMEGAIKNLEAILKTSTGQLSAAIEEKIAKVRRRRDAVLNPIEVGKCLDALEPVFDKMSERLTMSKKEAGSSDLFLFGPDLTAADICAFNFMFRLEKVGVCARFASPEIRPVVYQYYLQMKSRKGGQKCIEMSDRVVTTHMKMTAKSIGMKALKIGLVFGLVAIGYYGYKEYNKIYQGLAKA